MNEIDKAYWAGFFDGDGSVHLGGYGLTKNRHSFQYMCSVVIVNVVNIFDPLIKEFGGHITLQKSTKQGHRDTVAYRLYALKALRFIHAIYPHTKIKREELELALRFLATFSPHNAGKKLSPDIIAERNKLIGTINTIRNSNRQKMRIQLPMV